MALINSYNYTKPAGVVGRPIEKVNVRPVQDNKTNQYLESKILTAKPEELVYMLYEGMVKFIKKAQLAVEMKNPSLAHENTKKAQNIIIELRNTLNMDIPMADEMDQLYEFLDYKLFYANIDKDIKLYGEALEIAEDFKNTWKEAFHL